MMQRLDSIPPWNVQSLKLHREVMIAISIDGNVVASFKLPTDSMC